MRAHTPTIIVKPGSCWMEIKQIFFESTFPWSRSGRNPVQCDYFGWSLFGREAKSLCPPSKLIYNQTSNTWIIKLNALNYESRLMRGVIGKVLCLSAVKKNVSAIGEEGVCSLSFYTKTCTNTKLLSVAVLVTDSQSRGCVSRLLLPLINRLNRLQIWCCCAVWASLILI